MIITARSAGRIAVLILLFTILQVSFFSQIELLGTSMWILPVCAAIFGLLGGSLIGATVGFAIGFLSDGLSDGPLGSACLIFMGVGYLAGMYRERTDLVDPPTILAAGGISTLGSNLALGFYTVVVGFDASLSGSLIPDLILQALYGVLLAIPLYALIHRVLRPALIHEPAHRRRPEIEPFDSWPSEPDAPNGN
ncbi:MAG: rod shape-determining protein MreD [Solirubrobacterales bacterium]|nr:rod shape-determining protein MreD [Solirubrobacterales bacterium]